MIHSKFITLASAVALGVALASTSFHAEARGNAAEGQKKAESCKACHGEGGAKPIQPDYPILAGQQEDYLVAVLNQYKSGKRKNAIMGPFAKALSDKDIRDIAAYFAKEPSPLRMKY
jgi:cytochrome c553